MTAFPASHHSCDLCKINHKVSANDDDPDILREKCTELSQAKKTEDVSTDLWHGFLVKYTMKPSMYQLFDR